MNNYVIRKQKVMLGAIIGDIVGSRWEFNPTNDYNFEWLSEENDFTDDTLKKRKIINVN